MKRWLLLVLLLCRSADSWASDTFKFTHNIFLTCWSNKYLSKYINGVQYMLVHLSQSECLYAMTSCTEVGSSSVTVRCCYVDARCFFLLRITGTRLWTFLCELWCVVPGSAALLHSSVQHVYESFRNLSPLHVYVTQKAFSVYSQSTSEQ